VITDYATVDIGPKGFELVDVAHGHTADEVRALTGAPLR
jgi:acyl CoA:acetate/3-ketoacid CoA transferase beta subunit